MAEITSPIMLDSTGQAIVNAINNLQINNLVSGNTSVTFTNGVGYINDARITAAHNAVIQVHASGTYISRLFFVASCEDGRIRIEANGYDGVVWSGVKDMYYIAHK